MQILNYTSKRKISPWQRVYSTTISDKNNYLRGVDFISTPSTVKEKPPSKVVSHCWVNLKTKQIYDRQKLYQAKEYNPSRKQCRHCPPPTATSNTGNVKKNKDPIIPCQLYRGQQVVIASDRPSRFHWNGRKGKVAAVIYPKDASRSIIYVRLDDGCPCFFAHEVCPILEGGAA